MVNSRDQYVIIQDLFLFWALCVNPEFLNPFTLLLLFIIYTNVFVLYCMFCIHNCISVVVEVCICSSVVFGIAFLCVVVTALSMFLVRSSHCLVIQQKLYICAFVNPTSCHFAGPLLYHALFCTTVTLLCWFASIVMPQCDCLPCICQTSIVLAFSWKSPRAPFTAGQQCAYHQVTKLQAFSAICIIGISNWSDIIVCILYIYLRTPLATIAQLRKRFQLIPRWLHKLYR